MKAFTKIATAIVAGCALVGVTTGGAILLNNDDKDIIINVGVDPQDEPKDENPEVPGEEVTPEQPQEDENPTGEEVTPEQPQTDGYITIQVKIYNRNSGNLQSTEIIEYNNTLGTVESVSNLVYWTELNYPKRQEVYSPSVISEESKNLNDYLTYSSDHEIDLIVYLK